MGIQEDIKKMMELMVGEKEDVKTKKFKFPWGKKVSRSQKKKNYVTILLLNENGIYDFKKLQITEQTIMYETIPRLATAGHVMFDKKGNPLVILPSWSTKPFSPLENFEKSLTDGTNKKGFQILMNKMRLEQVSSKKKMGSAFKWIVGTVIAAIIGYALLTGGA